MSGDVTTTKTVRHRRLRTVGAVLVVAGWAGATIAPVAFLPRLSPSASRGALSGAISKSSPPIRAEIESVRRFAFPFLAQDVVVQHDPAGLSLAAQGQTAARAVQVDTTGLPGVAGIAGALPLTNELRLMPSSLRSGTTALTYLFYRPSLSPDRTTSLSEAYAKRYLSGPGMGLTGVTGAYPAEAQQGHAISGSLKVIELVSVGLLIVIVAGTFRSVVAPVVTLAAAGIAYELSQRLLAVATIHLPVTVPSELDPILIVLLLGIATDYSVFYLTAARRRIRQGADGRDAAHGAAKEVTSVVLAAGLTVAIGTAMITTAHLPLFAHLGPGLAVTVAVTVAVATTFVPATLWLLGDRVFWPARQSDKGRRSARSRLLGALRRPVAAAAVVVVGVGLLGAGGWALHHDSIGINLLGDLPAGDQAARAANAAGDGFAPGIVAPTEILLNQPAVSAHRVGLARLQAEIGRLPGVAGVLGPADSIPGLPAEGVFLAKDGGAARYLVVLDAEPLGSAAIADLHRVEAAMPAMVSRAGLSGRVRYAGDTAISAGITGPAKGDLLRVGGLVMLAILVVMAVFLRSLIAPVLLTLAGALTVAAALGVTSLVFSNPAGTAGFTFFVPFAAEVLLLAFGADYNLFLAGEIWRTSATRPFRDAVQVGAGRAASAINIAGITLASSFIVLMLVPLASFRELAVAMASGLLIDTFLVRLVVLPAALQLLGARSRWPRRPVPERSPVPEPSPVTDPSPGPAGGLPPAAPTDPIPEREGFPTP
ncbi:MMPL family transporter [Acidiferrimicrobium sp. IK]|uniref:MMPL family transporter n=1 Tax=Acidiferrimicrobium sp. IK TaxID=2871700 RepID=UPI0021CB562C|nr:MMPL family transporter [Acidiferrimicrobium sp. IK]MCU4183108.1 MMPL family transporter [Acidiferrimicrobium sp. IK]